MFGTGKLFAFLLATFSPLASAALATDFEWLIHHRPPFRVWHEDQSVSGLTVDRARAVFDHAGLTYNTQRSTVNRTIAILENNRIAACAEGWFKTTERLEFALYSEGFYRAKGTGVMTRKHRDDILDHDTFDTLFSDDRLVFGHRSKWSYGQPIDTFIDKHSPKIVSHNQTNEGALKFLLADKYDYILVSMDSAPILMSSVKQGKELLVAKRMVDSPPTPNRYIMCSQKVGQATMEKINASIQALGYRVSPVSR